MNSTEPHQETHPETHRILVVEDDPNILTLLDAYLSASGYSVTLAETGGKGLEQARSNGFDLLLLDVMLPQMTGTEIASAVRADGDQTPIIFLTALGSEANILDGFGVGADDYVVKPFSARELMVRVKAVLARTTKPGTKATAPASDLEIDPATHSCRWRGESLSLTPHEFRIIEKLAASPGRVFDRDQLVTALYPRGEAIGPKAIDVHVHNLRRKIGPDGDSVIQTVRGFGYRFDPTPTLGDGS